MRLGLLQTNQVREQERDSTQRSDELKLVVEQREQLQQRKKYAGRNASCDQRRHVAASGLVNVQAPAVCRKRLELEQQTGEQKHQRGEADRTGNGCACDNQIVDVENSGRGVEQHRADQEEGRRQDRRHQVFECRRKRGRRILQAEQAIGGDRDDLQEHEQIE